MPVQTDGRLARLTALAVGRAAALSAHVDADELGAYLYRAGGTAVDPHRDPRWAGVLADRAARPVRDALVAHDRTRTAHWNGWTAPGVDAGTLVHKVYVSPTTAALEPALGRVFATAARLRVPSWKVGADARGIHRADKVVLYLADATAADELAWVLAAELDDLAAQGVLFTGQVGASGIVSRGQDHGEQSWRSIVCRAVARALASERSAAGRRAPADRVAAAALATLADWFDVVTWHPGERAVA